MKKIASPAGPRKRSKSFLPSDAVRHHVAASLMTRRDRQAWAREANRTYRETGDLDLSIKGGNFELNCRVDEREILHRSKLIEYLGDARLLDPLRDDRGLVLIDRIEGGAEFEFIGKRIRDEAYTSGEIDLSRYLSLSREIERQRRRGREQ